MFTLEEHVQTAALATATEMACWCDTLGSCYDEDGYPVEPPPSARGWTD